MVLFIYYESHVVSTYFWVALKKEHVYNYSCSYLQLKVSVWWGTWKHILIVVRALLESPVFAELPSFPCSFFLLSPTPAHARVLLYDPVFLLSNQPLFRFFFPGFSMYFSNVWMLESPRALGWAHFFFPLTPRDLLLSSNLTTVLAITNQQMTYILYL